CCITRPSPGRSWARDGPGRCGGWPGRPGSASARTRSQKSRPSSPGSRPDPSGSGPTGSPTMHYQPIEHHGVIGNLRTAALVGMDGSIDWLCLPRFDSPSVFAAILDDGKGGRFRIAPPSCAGLRCKQFYWPETNILITRFLHPDGIAEVEDYMPVGGASGGPADQVVRRVRVVRGRMPLRLECRPAFDYARARHRTEVTGHDARFDAPGLSLGLASSVPLTP